MNFSGRACVGYVMWRRVDKGVEPRGVWCLDCIDALSREERAVSLHGVPVVQGTMRSHCTECGCQMTGPITGVSTAEPRGLS